MSDQANGLKDDISFMRSMAEQGRRGPLLGGVFLAAAGLIYGAASFLHWGIESGHLASAFPISDIWIGASVLFALVWVALFLRLRSAQHTAVGASQFTFGTAWAASGAGIMVLIGAIAIASARLSDPWMLELNALVAFAFYGVAWSVSAALAHQRWMFAVGLAAFAITLLLAFMLRTSGELLVFGFGLLLTLFAPGVKLMLSSR